MEQPKKIMRGEVYYIKSFMTTGHEQRAGRPAVIVSNNINNANSEVFEVVYLTKKEKPPIPTHVIIDRGPCKDSTVLCEQITSVAIDKIGDYICRVPDETLDLIDDALAISLGLPALLPFKDVNKDEVPEVKNEDYVRKDVENTISILTSSLENAKIEAHLYKKMYDELLDKLMGKRFD